MNISCKVIKDLLPLYADTVCSEDSKILVEEHLKTCESCKKELYNMKTDITSPRSEEFEKDKVKVLSKFAKNYNTKKRKTFLYGILICAVVCIMAAFGYKYYYVTPAVALPSEDFNIIDTKRLVNGYVLVEFEIKDIYKNTEVKTEFENGEYVIKAYCPRSQTVKSSGEVYSKYKILTYAKAEGNTVTTEDGETVNGIYLGKSKSDKVIWEKGMDIPEYGGKGLDKEVIGDQEYLNHMYENNDVKEVETQIPMENIDVTQSNK